MEPFKQYTPRPISFIEWWTFNDWKLKIYKICEEESYWDDRYLSIAKEIAQQELHLGKEDTHHFGFITIHIAKMFNQIIIDWWARENELRHIVFKAHSNTPTHFINITSTGEAFCIWELKVIEHERRAWIENILKNSEAPQFDTYIHQVLNITE